MRKQKTAAAKRQRTDAQAPDPRFAALARLLARHAARQDLARQNNSKPWTPDSPQGYDDDSLDEEEAL